MKRIPVCILFGLLAAIIILSGCGKQKIRVTSKQDVEGAILAQLIIQYLEHKKETDNLSIDIVDNTWMYTTDTLRDTLIDENIDIYPEYTGNGYLWFEDEDWKTWTLDSSDISDRLNELEDQQNSGLKWLEPAKAENNWAIVLNSQVAGKGLRTMEQFAEYVNDNPDGIIVYGSEAFFTRDNAFPLFEKEYGFTLKPEQKRYVSNPIFAENLAAFFVEDETIHASMAYTTDRYLEEGMNNISGTYIEELPLAVLEDTRNVQPKYYPAPLIRSEILNDCPDIEKYLGELFKKLDTMTLQKLNAEAVEKFPDEVAREFLKEKFPGFGDKENGIGLRTDRPPQSFFNFGENITIEVANARVTVPAHDIWETVFYVDDKFMKTSKLRGWFSVSGGAFNDIKIALLNDNDFYNWKNFRETADAVYLSEKVTKTQFDLEINEPGTYHLVLSNRFSEFSFKEVILKVYLYFSDKE
ncbi:MAG: hypothetical protein JW762_02300 [Dehalococcoidales bacterium]|nr:hypothetical protein [Dehalococcoidales bacterium]